MRSLWKIALLVVAAAVAYPAWLGFQVWDQSRKDELEHVDAIVVLGAAQYNGRPSPVFRARLDHAAYLYREHFSDRIVVTGGKQEGDRYTEAEAGRRYLYMAGVPNDAILSEDAGHTSLESLRNVSEMAERERIESVLLVSDPLHSERIKRMAHDLGFEESYTSPASYVALNRTRGRKLEELLYETGSVIVYELFER